MSFLPPPTSAAQTPKRPHLSVFQLSSYRGEPSSEPPAYSPHDVLAARYRRLAGHLHWARLAVSFITLIAGVVVVGCAASALHSYSSTQLDPQFMLPLWPSSIDLRPTRAIIACGALVTIFSLIYILAALLPTLRLLNTLSTPLAFLTLFISIFATAYASTITSHLVDSTSAGTLTSWTCKWSGFAATAPQGFAKICTESTVALDLVTFLVVVEAIAVLMSAAGWWIEAKVRRDAGEKLDG
ncbi:MAG: hypothetical protein Q9191_008080 [Dirinaria sp. TL-2023a]